MIIPLPQIALVSAALLTSLSPAYAALDVPSDTPVNQILSLAQSSLASGSSQDALAYYDIALSRDPKNYLTYFKRGATYLSLGRSPQALRDFDKVLAIKPGFEGALLQRAKIHARGADFLKAKADYVSAGRQADSEELTTLDAAQAAVKAAKDAERRKDWDACVAQSGVAIMTAPTALDLRRRRVRCRLEKGEVLEALGDLQHVLSLNPSATEPAIMISAMMFYSQNERKKGVEAVARCLHSDPDEKACLQLFKREKKIEKLAKKVDDAFARRKFSAAAALLVTPPPAAPDADPAPGLLDLVRADLKHYRAARLIHAKAGDALLAHLLDQACDAYLEMNNPKRAQPHCADALALNPASLPALLHKATAQLAADDFDAALATLAHARDHAPGAQSDRRLQDLHQKATVALKRSKTKDYYKVLDLPRDAAPKEIKKAFLRLSKLHHPDKAASADARPAAERKMAAINEAYEVLSDPELKARYDQGDDPNDPARGQGGGPPGGHPFGGFGGGGGPQFVFRQGGGFPGGGGGFKFQGGGFPGGFGF